MQPSSTQECSTSEIGADAIEQAVHDISEALSKKGIPSTPEGLRILNHKIDVILLFESYAKSLRGRG